MHADEDTNFTFPFTQVTHTRTSSLSLCVCMCLYTYLKHRQQFVDSCKSSCSGCAGHHTIEHFRGIGVKGRIANRLHKLIVNVFLVQVDLLKDLLDASYLFLYVCVCECDVLVIFFSLPSPFSIHTHTHTRYLPGCFV